MRILSPIISGSLTVSGASILSGSLNVTQGITGSLLGTATNALTASYLSGYVSPFPFTGSAIISGSLRVTGSASATSFVKDGGTSDQYLRADGSVSTALNSRIESNFIATANQTTFPLTYEVGQLEVFYNGSKLYPNEFTASNGTSFILSTGATEGAQISAVKYVSTLTTAAVRTETTFTTTLNQTTFSVNYTPGQVDVFYNGAKLNISEFTATNGTSVVLGFACAADESVSIISYVSQVSGASGTSGYLSKFTGEASLGDSQIFDDGINVGIGKDSSNAKLDVDGNTIITGSLTVTQHITGSLLGTASNAVSASFATTASFANVSGLGGFVQGGNSFGSQATLGTNDNQSLALGTNGTTRMFISSSGNVGIGTTTPSFPLDVNGKARFTVDTGATIDMSTPGGTTGIVYNTSATNNYSRFNTYNSPNATSTSRYFALEWDDNNAGLRIAKSGTVSAVTSTGNLTASTTTIAITSGGQFGSIGTPKNLDLSFLGSSNTELARIRSWDESYSTGYGYLTFSTHNGASLAEKMRINPNGRVGINTTNPNGTLHVETDNSSVRIGRTGGMASIKAIAGYDGNMIIDADGSGAVYLNHYNTGNVYIGTGGGNLGVGTSSPGQKLDVVGNIRGTSLLVENTGTNQQISFRKSGAQRYAIGTEVGPGATTDDWAIYNYVAGSTSYLIYGNNNYRFYGTNVSDARAKKEITDLEFNFLEKVQGLRPRSYFMKDDDSRLNYGFIAQEVHEVLPDLIGGDLEGEGFIGLDYNGLLPVLVGAIKEQQALIQSLTDRLSTLENK